MCQSIKISKSWHLFGMSAKMSCFCQALSSRRRAVNTVRSCSMELTFSCWGGQEAGVDHVYREREREQALGRAGQGKAS